MRGEGPGFPLRRHRHLPPAQQRRVVTRAGRSLPASLLLRDASPGTKSHLLCVWASVGCPLAPWGQHRTSYLPAPPSPASSAPEPAAQMWPDTAAGAESGVQWLGHVCPRAGTGGVQPCSGDSCASHFPARFRRWDRPHEGRASSGEG